MHPCCHGRSLQGDSGSPAGCPPGALDRLGVELFSAVGKAAASTSSQDSPAQPGTQQRQSQQPLSPLALPPASPPPPHPGPAHRPPSIFISQFYRQSVTQARLDGGPGAQRQMGNALGLEGPQGPDMPSSLLPFSAARHTHASSPPALSLFAASPGQCPARLAHSGHLPTALQPAFPLCCRRPRAQ